MSSVQSIVEGLSKCTPESDFNELALANIFQYSGYAKAWPEFKAYQELHGFHEALKVHQRSIWDYTPDFTKSIDAALSLIPEGFTFVLTGTMDPPDNPTHRTASISNGGDNPKTTVGYHAMLPVAICLALLQHVEHGTYFKVKGS